MLESGSAQAPAEGGRGWAANRHQEIPHITSFSWGISGTSIVTPPPHPSRAPQHGRSSVMPGAFPVLGAEHQFIDERMVRASAWSERGWGKSGFQSEKCETFCFGIFCFRCVLSSHHSRRLISLSTAADPDHPRGVWHGGPQDDAACKRGRQDRCRAWLRSCRCCQRGACGARFDVWRNSEMGSSPRSPAGQTPDPAGAEAAAQRLCRGGCSVAPHPDSSFRGARPAGSVQARDPRAIGLEPSSLRHKAPVLFRARGRQQGFPAASCDRGNTRWRILC